MRHLLLSLGLAAHLLGQTLESPNSYVALTVGGSLPSGPSASKGALYPTSGYLQNGAAVGLQLTTFIMPYLSLNLRLSQSFLPMDAKALGKTTASSQPPSLSVKPPTSPIR
jgi:hypothetical protein